MLREYERWLRYEKDLTESTIRGYVAVLRKVLRELGEPRRTDDGRLEQIRDYLRGTSRSHQVNVLTAWQHWCEFLGEPRNVGKPTNKPRKPVYLTKAEIEELLDACETTKERAVILFLTATGLRASELVALNQENVLWDESIIHVREAKRGSTRYVAISPGGLGELRL